MNNEYLKQLNRPWLKISLAVFGSFLALFLVFSFGVRVGFYKAGFSGHLSENYYRNFDGRDQRSDKMPLFGRGMPLAGEGVVGGFGAAGEILEKGQDYLNIIDRDGLDKIVAVNDKTLIKRLRETISLNDLLEGDMVVVVGRPDKAGRIEAKLIRMMPAPQVGSDFGPLPARGKILPDETEKTFDNQAVIASSTAATSSQK
jgi:hypothetical protein